MSYLCVAEEVRSSKALLHRTPPVEQATRSETAVATCVSGRADVPQDKTMTITPVRINIRFESPRHRNRKVPFALILLLFASMVIASAGCSHPSESTASGSAGAKQTAPAAGSVTQTPTPEQEAARQKAIAEGPAIEAAIKAQQSH